MHDSLGNCGRIISLAGGTRLFILAGMYTFSENGPALSNYADTGSVANGISSLVQQSSAGLNSGLAFVAELSFHS